MVVFKDQREVQWLGKTEGLVLDQDVKLIGYGGKVVGASKVILSLSSPLVHAILKGQCECAEQAVVLVPWAHHNTLNKFNNAIKKIFSQTGTESDALRNVEKGNCEKKVEEDSIQKQEFFTFMKELNICPEFQGMIWSFAEKDDEKKVSNASSMETATISSSSKISCETAKSDKQSQTDESLLSSIDNLQSFCPRTGQTELGKVLHPTSSQGIERCMTKKPSLETLPWEMLNLVIKQLDIESKKNLRLANRYFLEMMTKLEKVLMKHWKFKEMTGGKLKRLADQVQTVKGIDLEFCDEEYSGREVNRLESGLRYLLKEHKELESVKISKSHRTNDRTLPVFTDSSLEAIFSHQSMKSIDLEFCEITGEIDDLCEITREIDDLEFCEITGEIDVTTTKLALQVLKLVFCIELTEIGLVCLLNMIDGESLRELDLAYSNILFYKISSCITTFPNLEVLDLNMCIIKEENLKAFLRRTGDRLKKITLCCNDISLASIGTLPITFPWLEELDLSNCDNLTDSGLISLLNKVGVQLTHLSIADSSSISLSQADSLISNFPKLTYLYMQGCRNITDSSLLSLLNRTGCLSSLRHLNIEGTNVSLTYVTDIRARYPNIRIYWYKL